MSPSRSSFIIWLVLTKKNYLPYRRGFNKSFADSMCHPELNSGSYLFLDSEPILNQVQHRVQNDRSVHPRLCLLAGMLTFLHRWRENFLLRVK
jgi:hypothetical protein